MKKQTKKLTLNKRTISNVTAVPTGSTFDIHFQVIDAVSMAVVLTSDCYQYTVR